MVSFPAGLVSPIPIFPGARLHVSDGVLRVGTLEDLSDGGSYHLQVAAKITPVVDGLRALGSASQRWTGVWAVDGSINTSDARDKTNITSLDHGLAEILQLQPVRFEWKDILHHGEKLGLLAQDVLAVIPEVVVTHTYEQDENDGSHALVETDRLGMYYSDLIPVLVKAIQEQQEIIEDLQASLKRAGIEVYDE